MRIAALAFGVLAGLVASFILALGGLDAAELRHLDGRQMQLVAFGLFVIANLGVLGAGLVLAAPLAATILFVVGAIGWFVAAVAMHHGPDFVMLTPPGILLVAAALSIAAVIRRRPTRDRDEDFSRRESVAAQRAAMRDAGEEDDEDGAGEQSGVAVGATFFGDHGTATALRGAMPPPTDPRRDTWEPVRRRVEPPRQKPMFRSVEDEYDDDEESGASRVARGISSVLSFGLYAALAAAAVLIFWNLRTGDVSRNTATKIEASASLPQTSAPVVKPSPSSSSSPPTVVAEAPAAPTLSPTRTASLSPELTAPSPEASIAPQLPAPASASSVAAALPAAPTLPPPSEAPSSVAAAEASPPSTSAESSSSEAAPASSAEPEGADDLAGSGVTGPLMPYPMPAVIAAGRPTAKPRPAAPAAPAPRVDTGL